MIFAEAEAIVRGDPLNRPGCVSLDLLHEWRVVGRGKLAVAETPKASQSQSQTQS